MVGVDRLRFMAMELYGDTDPVFDFEATSPFRILETEAGVQMEIDIPFVAKSDLDVFRTGHELYVQVGPYRRSFILPRYLSTSILPVRRRVSASSSWRFSSADSLER